MKPTDPITLTARLRAACPFDSHWVILTTIQDAPTTLAPLLVDLEGKLSHDSDDVSCGGFGDEPQPKSLRRLYVILLRRTVINGEAVARLLTPAGWSHGGNGGGFMFGLLEDLDLVGDFLQHVGWRSRSKSSSRHSTPCPGKKAGRRWVRRLPMGLARWMAAIGNRKAREYVLDCTQDARGLAGRLYADIHGLPSDTEIREEDVCHYWESGGMGTFALVSNIETATGFVRAVKRAWSGYY
jgi:hypothetical protein